MKRILIILSAVPMALGDATLVLEASNIVRGFASGFPGTFRIYKKYDNHYEHDKQAGIRTHQPG